MKTLRILVLFLTLFPVALAAQNEPIQLGVTGSDCIGALEINDTIIGPVFSPKGFGNKLELVGYELGDPYFIQREHNSVWYKFTIPYDCIFTFDLIPIQKDDDFDFLLFLYDGPNFCRDITDGKKIPIRTNISRKNIEVQGQTGLSESSIDEYVPSGPGSSYSRALKAKRGKHIICWSTIPSEKIKGIPSTSITNDLKRSPPRSLNWMIWRLMNTSFR